MWIFCGLGNPGVEYLLTRHNFGFMVVDAFAERHSLKFKKAPNFEAEITYYEDKAMFIKPLTFMNLSGRAVKKVLEATEIGVENLMVIYDDMDLPLGRMKILPKGGAGGHKGLLSIIESLQTKEFPRMKLGIDKPPDKNYKDYVLSPFSTSEIEIVRKVIELACSALEDLLSQDLLKVMTKYNSLNLL